MTHCFNPAGMLFLGYGLQTKIDVILREASVLCEGGTAMICSFIAATATRGNFPQSLYLSLSYLRYMTFCVIHGTSPGIKLPPSQARQIYLAPPPNLKPLSTKSKAPKNLSGPAVSSWSSSSTACHYDRWYVPTTYPSTGASLLATRRTDKELAFTPISNSSHKPPSAPIDIINLTHDVSLTYYYNVSISHTQLKPSWDSEPHRRSLSSLAFAALTTF